MEQNELFRPRMSFGQMFIGVAFFTCIALAPPRIEALSRSPDFKFFNLTFLGNPIEFSLNPSFSAVEIATRFLREILNGNDIHEPLEKSSIFDSKIIAVRDLIENAVAEFLGSERIEAGFEKKDPVAAAFIEAVCRDFPQNHGMPYDRFAPRQSPIRVIDGTQNSRKEAFVEGRTTV